MLFSILIINLLFTSNHVAAIPAVCDSYAPAFPLPELSPNDPILVKARETIKAELLRASEKYASNVSTWSVEVTSQKETLFDFHHSAEVRDEARPGVKQADGDTRYRIASITKTFTTLAIIQLQKAGKLNLDDPVNKYLPELDKHQTGSLPWKDITIRTLGSQLSGIPRDMGILDIFNEYDAIAFGFPPINDTDVESCDCLRAGSRSCTKKDLIKYLRRKEPVFAPKQQSTYSNLNYDLLGLVIEKVSGETFSDYIDKHILKELDMTSTTFETPPDSVGALVKNFTWGWDSQMDVQRPTGGLYSSSHDIAKWARYVLTHYNGLTPALNWLLPVSWSTGTKDFYGFPWEIHRTDSILPYTRRTVTFANKGGGWPGYTTLLSVVPEYGFGFFAATAGTEQFTIKAAGIIGRNMVKAADEIAQRQARDAHVGIFAAPCSQNLNSTIIIDHSPERGLYISHFISNSTDVRNVYRQLLSDAPEDGKYYVQLTPTLLFKDEKHQAGEIWRVRVINEDEDEDNTDLFSGVCVTDVDPRSYGGLPFTEIVFWSKNDAGVFDEVEVTAYRVKLERPTLLNEDTSSPSLIERLKCSNGNVAADASTAQKVMGNDMEL